MKNNENRANNNSNNEMNILREQYKLAVDSYDNIQNRRAQLDTAFVTLYSVVVGLFNFLNNQPITSNEASFFTFLLGIAIGLIWIGMIRKGQRAERSKYAIIQKIEDSMPVRVFTVKGVDAAHSEKTDRLFHPGNYELLIPVVLIIVLVISFFVYLY